MTGTKVSFNSDRSCALIDEIDGTQVAWATVEKWAADWFAELDAKRWGAAHDFIHLACSNAVAGVVDALVVLAEVADGHRVRLGSVGAGPLEDLVSHSGIGLQVLPEVERAARQSAAFRVALGSVWVSLDVPGPVRERLAELGATKLGES